MIFRRRLRMRLMRSLKTLCTENDLINKKYPYSFVFVFLLSFWYVEIVLVDKMGEEDVHDWHL